MSSIRTPIPLDGAQPETDSARSGLCSRSDGLRSRDNSEKSNPKSSGLPYLSPGHVGLFDSGLGGLSVLAPLRELAPNFILDYFADSLYCPYGLRDPKFIRQRSLKISEKLIRRGAEIVVVACNTASAAGLNWLRKRLPVPVVGMEPAVKPAAMATRNGRIGVLATGVTLSAERFARLLECYTNEVQVFAEAAPELVAVVENGELHGEHVYGIVNEKVGALLAQRVDTIVLGCTHFPFLWDIIREIVGPKVNIIETGRSVATQTIRVHRSVAEKNVAGKTAAPFKEMYPDNNAEKTRSEFNFWTSSQKEKALQRSQRLMPGLDVVPGWKLMEL